MFDPKGLADSIVAGEDPESMEAGETDESAMSDEDLLAEDVLAAFAENDPKALVTALKSLWTSFDAQPHVEGGTKEQSQ